MSKKKCAHQELPIHVAAHNNHKNIVSYLLTLGAHQNAKDRNGKTALDYFRKPEEGKKTTSNTNNDRPIVSGEFYSSLMQRLSKQNQPDQKSSSAHKPFKEGEAEPLQFKKQSISQHDFINMVLQHPGIYFPVIVGGSSGQKK